MPEPPCLGTRASSVDGGTRLTRPLTPGDAEAWHFLQLASYGDSGQRPTFWDFENVAEEIRHVRGVFEKDELIAGLQIFPMKVYFGDRLLPSAGLAFVATAPHRRRQGHAFAMFRDTLVELRDTGCLLSSLYPFAFPFYRRLGWEQAADMVAYEAPLADLPLTRPDGATPERNAGGRIRLVAHCRPGGKEEIEDDTVPVLQEIYRRYARLHNGMMERDEAWWRRHLLRATSVARFTALWEDNAGRPGGYVIYGLPSFAPGPQDIRVRELVAVTAEAYGGILAFLRNQEAVFRNLLVNLPPSDPFPFFLLNPRVKRELRTHHMLRLVNLAPALEAAAEPSSAAKVEMILSVEDPVCSWNDGEWLLTVEASRAKVINMGKRTAPPRVGLESVRGQRLPRVATDVRALVQIVSGYARAATLERAGRLVASESAAVTLLDAVYGRRPSHLIDYF